MKKEDLVSDTLFRANADPIRIGVGHQLASNSDSSAFVDPDDETYSSFFDSYADESVSEQDVPFFGRLP